MDYNGTLWSPGRNSSIREFTEYTVDAQPEELSVLDPWISRVVMCEIAVLVPEGVSMDEKPQLVGIDDQ